MYTINIKNIEMLRITMSLSIAYLTETTGMDIDDYMDCIENPQFKYKINDTQINTITRIFGVTREFITQTDDIDPNPDNHALNHLRQFQKKLGEKDIVITGKTGSGREEMIKGLVKDIP